MAMVIVIFFKNRCPLTLGLTVAVGDYGWTKVALAYLRTLGGSLYASIHQNGLDY